HDFGFVQDQWRIVQLSGEPFGAESDTRQLPATAWRAGDPVYSDVREQYPHLDQPNLVIAGDFGQCRLGLCQVPVSGQDVALHFAAGYTGTPFPDHARTALPAYRTNRLVGQLPGRYRSRGDQRIRRVLHAPEYAVYSGRFAGRGADR